VRSSEIDASTRSAADFSYICFEVCAGCEACDDQSMAVAGAISIRVAHEACGAAPLPTMLRTMQMPSRRTSS
jgi:hypothetical protein